LNPLGVSAARVKQKALVAEFERELGGHDVLTAGDLALIERAADLLVLKAPNARVAVYMASGVNRIIQTLRHRHGLGNRKRPRAARSYLAAAVKQYGSPS